MISIILISSLTVFSQSRTNLFTQKVEEEKTSSVVVRRKPAGPPAPPGGNLPLELRSIGHFNSEESPIILPTNKSPIRLKGVEIGEVIQAEIKESLFAFNESKAPVRAVINRGPLSESILIGEASLEKNSKRILIEFKKLRSRSETWSLQASALDGKGILGIEGEIISNEGKYFASELAAAGAAGLADATVKREQTSTGTYVEVPGVDTISKKAITSALSRTADRYSEKLKTVPEYAVLEGPIEIQILITDQPKPE